MTTLTTSASVSIDRPGRYGKQLTAHLGRRRGGEWDAAAGTGCVQLGDARLELVAREAALELAVDAPAGASAADLDRLEDVVGRHLVRFATHDTLEIAWRRNDGSAGSRQVSDPDDAPAHEG